MPANFWDPDVVASRFWSKVDKNGPTPPHRPELGPCWVWTKNRNKRGYGYVWIRSESGNGRSVGAHQFAWELENGPIPDGLEILHRCDNPPCCRPSHVQPGTRHENMQDAWDKGRMAGRRDPSGEEHWARRRCPTHVQGERNPNAKLTDGQVAELRAAYDPAKRGSKAALARQYGISPTHVALLVSNRSRAPRKPPSNTTRT